MYVLLWLVLIFLFLAGLILPWMNRARINQLRRDLDSLATQVAQLNAGKQANTQTEKTPLLSPVTLQPATIPQPLMSGSVPRMSKENTGKVMERQVPQTPQPQPAKPQKPKLSFEQQFGARLPVWIGGVALALAGLFMVKYSIETGLLSPAVRLVIGGLFGVAMLAVAHVIRRKPGIADGARISQALSGAGIADLYVCFFAATSYYHFLPAAIGFAAMAAVTALAVVLSVRYGPPIALLGLVGGFLTPALINTGTPNAPLLFMYLYFVLAGLFTVLRKQGWWWLAIPTVIAAFLWVVAWIGLGYATKDSIWLGAFLIAVSITIAAGGRHARAQAGVDMKEHKRSVMLGNLSMGGAVVLMGIVAIKAQLGWMEWGMFGILTVAALALAYFQQSVYKFVPWLALAVNVVMLAVWHPPTQAMYATLLFAFAALYGVAGYVLMWRAQNPTLFAALVSVSPFAYYLLAHAKLKWWLLGAAAVHMPALSGAPVWGLLAMAAAILAVLAIQQVQRRFHGPEKTRQEILAAFALSAAGFLAIGLTVELRRDFLPVAIACEMFAVSLLAIQSNILALRKIAAVLAFVFTTLLLPYLLWVVYGILHSIDASSYDFYSGWFTRAPAMKWPLFQLGIPALMFGASSVLLRRKGDDLIVRAFEAAAVALVTLMAYNIVRDVFDTVANMRFIERGIFTNLLFAIAAASFWVGRKYSRPVVVAGAIILVVAAVARLVWFDLLTNNPLFDRLMVGELPFINGLLITYGLPVAWLWHIHHDFAATGREGWQRYTAPLMLVLAFMLVTTNVRQLFHGAYLNAGATSNAEIYSYSAAWLLLGVGLLLTGTLRHNRMLRIASLLVMLVTVGKVFLYDAAELTGLFRVFSFLGLGLSLMALSWFYTRYVFAAKNT